MRVDPFREPPTRIFYPLRKGVLVTNQRFQALGRSYPMCELRNVTWSIGSMQARRRLLLRLLAAETPISAALVLVVPSLLAVACAIGYLLMATAVMWIGGRCWPTPRVLWANHRGQLVLLYRSADHREFHQVSRALLRALEQSPCRSIR